MSISVGIHPPKTPVTSGSNGIAKVTTPNVCKMPGPPAPFVPSPLPNIGKSGNSPKDYSKTVEIESCKVAIRGATFESMGDMASKGTGGGLISANTHGPTKFITPGSLTVKIEGKSVHLLGEPMLNNCAASGTPPNTGATLSGEDQGDQDRPDNEKDIKCAIHECDQKRYNLTKAGDDPCAALGKMKHACVANHKKIKDKEDQIFSETFVNMRTTPPTVLTKAGKGVHNVFRAKAMIGRATGYRIGELRRPDLIYRDTAGNRVVADAKFPCPEDVASGAKKSGKMASPSDSASMLTGDQRDDYEQIQGNGKPPQEIQPSDCSSEDCG